LDKAWGRLSASLIPVDADPEEQKAVLVTFVLQDFRLGLTDFSATLWESLSSE
jgi:hypothetical protein